MPGDEDRPIDPWSAVLGFDTEPESVPDRLTAVPDPAASWWRIADFAMTYDAYRHFGGFEPLATMAHAAQRAWRDSGDLPVGLDEARGALFFEQRAHRHSDTAPRGETLEYAQALVERIRQLSDGVVTLEEPTL